MLATSPTRVTVRQSCASRAPGHTALRVSYSASIYILGGADVGGEVEGVRGTRVDAGGVGWAMNRKVSAAAAVTEDGVTLLSRLCHESASNSVVQVARFQ